MKFSKGDYFDYNGKRITVKDFLGAGGQGEVYLVNDGIKDYAFKCYIEEQSSDFKYNLKNNIMKGSPANTFLWPKQFIEFTDNSCGYLMDVRPKNYCSFVSYLNGKVNFPNYRTLLNWCIELVKSFKKLHEKGFSYQDLNDGSFFLEPNTGELLICDNDNVTADKRNLGVLGKMRYMAPEIVRGDKDPYTGLEQMPDTHSDRFSLAIILFLALCKGNPFEGERLKKYVLVDEKAEYEMFGLNPVYIYNKNDKSNRPIRGYHKTVLYRYEYLPIYIKNAFHRTFVDGLKDRENGRVTEIEWLMLLCRYRDELISCKCGKEYIYGFEESNHKVECPYCKNNTRTFCYLTIGKSKILLEPGKKLYAFHLDKYSSEYNKVVGEVVQNKTNPNFWGIKYDLDENVVIQDAKGNSKELLKNGVIPIVANLNIKFKENVIGIINVENVN